MTTRWSINSHMEAVLSGDGPAHSTAWRGPGRGGANGCLTDSLSASGICSASVHAATLGPRGGVHIQKMQEEDEDWCFHFNPQYHLSYSQLRNSAGSHVCSSLAAVFTRKKLTFKLQIWQDSLQYCDAVARCTVAGWYPLSSHTLRFPLSRRRRRWCSPQCPLLTALTCSQTEGVRGWGVYSLHASFFS